MHVYTDGSVLVNHGGTEMGQGLHTKVSQVVALELGIDVAQVRATANDTSKVANTSATAASTGSDLNGKAAQDAARQIRNRLARVLSPTRQHGADRGRRASKRRSRVRWDAAGCAFRPGRRGLPESRAALVGRLLQDAGPQLGP